MKPFNNVIFNNFGNFKFYDVQVQVHVQVSVVWPFLSSQKTHNVG
jgi:hypothetical protein